MATKLEPRGSLKRKRTIKKDHSGNKRKSFGQENLRPSLIQIGALQQEDNSDDELKPQESFFLRLLMTFIIVGDAEQSRQLCEAYFFNKDENLKGKNQFFIANLRRIYSLATLNEALSAN